MSGKMKGSQAKVKVVIRVRPPLSTDSRTCVTTAANKVQIVNHRNTTENLLYEFTSVYNETTGQHTVFSECVEPLLDNVFHGQNVSVFAYGPTGAGKTHTMLGTVNDPGIIPRVLRSLFKKLSSESETAAVPPVVSFSYMEIYNEKVQDLLSPGSSDLPIREDAHHNIFVAGATEKVITSFEDFRNFFGPASSNRTVAATKLNEASSRSHSILQLKVKHKVKDKTYTGKIYLIDLAGSEDNRRTGNQGIRLKESGAINKSLFVLGEVVDAINNNLIRVPYRNSKLTRLLQDSIGGSCHSVMITNIAPEHHYYYDTYCTLNFATKSRKIVNVNTVCVKEDSPPVLVKPVVPLQPSKRRAPLSSDGPAKKSKRRSSSSTAVAATSSTELSAGPPAAATYSPLERRQAELESVVAEKFQAMERLVNNVLSRQEADQVALMKQDLQTAMTSARTSPRRRSCRLSSSVRPESSPDIITATPDIARTKLKDTTNLMMQRFLGRPGPAGKMTQQQSTGAGGPLALKRRQEEGPSCSPLFLTPAAKSHKVEGQENQDLSPSWKKAKAAAGSFQNEEQSRRDADFLSMLNTGGVKELQTLQRVGKKRAQLIYEWRQIHGPFSEVDDLTELPGFTQKILTTLLRSNLISHAN